MKSAGRSRRAFLCSCGIVAQVWFLSYLPARAAEEYEGLISTIQAVGPEAAGYAAAGSAVRQLSAAELDALIPILAGMQDGRPLANNWLSAAAAAVADRGVMQGQSLPQARLTEFVQDRSQAADARYAAFRLLAQASSRAAQQLIPAMLDDPCLDLRRRAVAWEIEQGEALAADSTQQQAAVEKFHSALAAARDVDQIEQLAEKLKSLGSEVDLVRHFGFLVNWHLIGPFDNVGSRSFDVAYPPEAKQPPDLAATYPGKEGEVAWQRYTTDDEFGVVDLNEALARHKGAIAYAYTEFTADDEVPVELRLGCINGNKVWLNGQLLTSNEVYHSSTAIDQYVGRGTLRPGRNSIVVKIAQNEQTESWAQRWQFQLRVCDALGSAVLTASNIRETNGAQ